MAGGLNLYNYTANNPINATDPYGLETLPVPGVGPGVGIPWHPGFQPGTPENDYIVNDIEDYIEWNLTLPWKILIWMAGDDCPSPKGDKVKPPKKKPIRTGQDALDQLEGAEKAREDWKKGKRKKPVDFIDKSKQRFKGRIKNLKTPQDYYDDFD